MKNDCCLVSSPGSRRIKSQKRGWCLRLKMIGVFNIKNLEEEGGGGGSSEKCINLGAHGNKIYSVDMALYAQKYVCTITLALCIVYTCHCVSDEE